MAIGQNRDARIPVISFNEPVVLMGRFAGNGASAPLAVSGTTKGGLGVTYTNTGNMTLTIPTPTGVFQKVELYLNQLANTNAQTSTKTIQSSPPANGASTIPFRVVYMSNNANVDIATTDELNVEVWFSNSSYP